MQQKMNPASDRDLDHAIATLKSIRVEWDAASRHRLARQCAENLTRRPPRFLERLGSLYTLFVPTGSLAVAMGTLVVLAAVSLSVTGRHAVPVQPAPAHAVQLVSIKSGPAGRVTLEWRDGSQATYRVLKSDNPRDFSKAASFKVRGNRWTDPSGEVGRVVYYRVE